jgi:hypothetical protein
MATQEIDEEEIDVEDIMYKIREKIKVRRSAQAGDEEMPKGGLVGAKSLNRDLRYVNSNWDIRNNSYFISSHRPAIGSALKKGRELVHGEIRRYVDPMIFKQNEFNSSTARLLSTVLKRLDQIDLRLDDLEKQAGASDTALSKIREEIGTIREEMEPIRRDHK